MVDTYSFSGVWLEIVLLTVAEEREEVGSKILVVILSYESDGIIVLLEIPALPRDA